MTGVFWGLWLGAALTAATPAFAAATETIAGVITNVDRERPSITVRNDETGRRHTYFFSADSRISTAGDVGTLLDRGVGWIEGTAALDVRGNTGLAAHRDGFFRGLKDIAVGDRIGLTSRSGHAQYVVIATEIVKPEAVHVLAPSIHDTLTLVTCHPFYFVGSAPNRFVVRAMLEEGPTPSTSPGFVGI